MREAFAVLFDMDGVLFDSERAVLAVWQELAAEQGLVAELAVFDPEDKDTLRKLRKFFSRFGYEPVDCAYRLGGVPAELMVKPIKGTAEIGPVVHRVIRDFYARVLNPARLEKMVEIRRA